MIPDDLIREAAEAYENAVLVSLPNPASCNHKFSSNFERKMKRVTWRANHSSAHQIFKRIACAVLVITLCISIFVMLNTDVRATVIYWVKKQYAFFTGYFSSDDTTDETVKGYNIGWLPKDYTLLDQTDLPDGKIVLYVDAGGQLLQFSYSFHTNESSTFISEGMYSCNQTCVAGQSADVYISSDPAYSNGLVWTGYNDNALFVITAYCDEATMIQIAESVYEIKK